MDEIGFRPITAADVNSYDETVTLVIRDAATGALQSITSNRVHPYFVSLVAPSVHLAANDPTLRGTLTTGRFVEAQPSKRARGWSRRMASKPRSSARRLPAAP